MFSKFDFSKPLSNMKKFENILNNLYNYFKFC